MLISRRLLASSLVLGWFAIGHSIAYCQQTLPNIATGTRSILDIEDIGSGTPTFEEPSPSDAVTSPKVTAHTAVDRVTGKATNAPVALTSSSSKSTKPLRSVDRYVDADHAELIRDRYPSGKVRVERSVTLDAQGNYVNHGEYRELSEKGELLVTGTYNAGQRVGVWAKFLQPGDAKLLSAAPFNKFRPPFSSTVEFQDSHMHGVWVISDRDKRIAAQIELKNGSREGIMTFYHTNGQIYLQSNFSHGVLDGLSIEKNQDGKLVHEDHYAAGQKLVIDTEYYPNKSVKSVQRSLTAPQRVLTADNWDTTMLATYGAAGNATLHGEFITYHENGQVATKGMYDHGKLDGTYESWFKTGEPSASGSYSAGVQVGEWTWRHANGMKRAMAQYVDGKVQGETRAWDESGKAVTKN